MSEQKRFHLTRDAVDKLKAELAYLEGEGRQRVIDEISRARAHGDLSENAEYHAAKDQQGLQEARVRQIRHMLENAEILTAADDGVAGPGKLVTIRFAGDDPETYLLGLREEPSEHYDVLTPESPLGRALVGRSTGESVTATMPDGNEVEVELVEVRPAT